jgi:acyl-CoA thioesterase FadM
VPIQPRKAGARPVDRRIERDYRVRFDEAGESGHLRSSGFLRYAQDLAWIHSESAGFGRDWYAGRGLTWLVRTIELHILDDVAYGAALTVSTEVVGFRRVWARRRSEFVERGAGRTLAVALTDWVLLNARGVPMRVPAEILDVFPAPPADYTPARLELPETPPDAERTTISPRHADLDPMGHVNNAVYLDYLEEHLALVGRRAAIRRRPRRYRAEFLDAAQQGMVLTGEGWPANSGYAFRLRGPAGAELLRARIEIDSASWVGG